MAGKRKVYSPEFEFAAVTMVTDQKLSVAEVARRFGVTEDQLHDWQKAVLGKGADASPGSGHLTPPPKRRTASSCLRSSVWRWSGRS